MNVQLFQWLNEAAGRYAWLDDLMKVCAQDIVWIMLAILALMWFTGRESNQKLVVYACLTAAAALLLASLISPEVNHPRPFVDHQVNQLIPHAPDPSFPSDHATLAFSLAFAVLFGNRRFGVLLLGLATLTGIARVFVGVHYPADIAGAVVLSFIVGIVVWGLRWRLEAVPLFFIRLYRKIVPGSSSSS
ncbi:undecaprenyl-diphosphatase [Cohnella nanjingensis]|uniref:Undecaprenyl-diphosphatase n=1 Tax=Cohnella nanjingensis TaxID=1387779 RepID=A0A7X0RKS8_9BACL|nr:undecaprenyl-diphosphatase [Cohnella nanjingensis]MBB6669287.1 undecaprenyl-diphosphatase [Cohnella nanjingensis]